MASRFGSSEDEGVAHNRFQVIIMAPKKITSVAIQRALTRLEDPEINSEIMLASTPTVAKLIVDSLPGVRRLIKGGPQAAKAVLAWLDTEATVQNHPRSAIGLYILEHFPSEEVKLTLAKYISKREFTAFNSRLAADTFLKAAGIELKRGEDPIAVALRESKRIMRGEPEGPEVGDAGNKTQTREPVTSE